MKENEMRDNMRSDRSITTEHPQMVTGMFADRTSTENAYNALHERGYTKDDIDLVMSDETRKKHFSSDNIKETEIGTKAAEGAGKGSAIGGTVGAVAGAIAASDAISGVAVGVADPGSKGCAASGAPHSRGRGRRHEARNCCA